MQARPILSRREGLLAGLGAMAAASLAGPARAMLPAVATLLVPGPEDGGFARFAGRLAASLGRGATTAIIAPQHRARRAGRRDRRQPLRHRRRAGWPDPAGPARPARRSPA